MQAALSAQKAILDVVALTSSNVSGFRASSLLVRR